MGKKLKYTGDTLTLKDGTVLEQIEGAKCAYFVRNFEEIVEKSKPCENGVNLNDLPIKGEEKDYKNAKSNSEKAKIYGFYWTFEGNKQK